MNGMQVECFYLHLTLVILFCFLVVDFLIISSLQPSVSLIILYLFSLGWVTPSCDLPWLLNASHHPEMLVLWMLWGNYKSYQAVKLVITHFPCPFPLHMPLCGMPSVLILVLVLTLPSPPDYFLFSSYYWTSLFTHLLNEAALFP